MTQTQVSWKLSQFPKIYQLKKKIKDETKPQLNDVAAYELIVYHSRIAVSEFHKESKNYNCLSAPPPTDTLENNPVIVVAPSPEPKQEPGKKKRQIQDFLIYHHAAIETSLSKLIKVKKLEGSSMHCFLCCISGSKTNQIDASPVLQKQDIYATKVRKHWILLTF